jgi:hypothetical protein
VPRSLTPVGYVVWLKAQWDLTLLKSPAIRSGRNINEALEVFIKMLDSIDFTRGKASERGKGVSGNLEEEEVNQEDRESNFDESETRDKRSKLDSDSEDGEEPSSK